MGGGQAHQRRPIIILLWVLSGLILGSVPLILKEKLIVNLSNGDAEELFHTAQRDSTSHSMEAERWPAVRVAAVTYSNTDLLITMQVSSYNWMISISPLKTVRVTAKICPNIFDLPFQNAWTFQ